jgi:hypothetical protein
MIPYQVAPRPLVPHVKPVRDPKYLAYVRQFPCVGCVTTRRPREAMHIGPHGIAQKASDLDCLPGCRECHRELHKIGPVKFQERRKIEFAILQRMFRRFYCLKFGTSDWWPNQPNLTLQTCSECRHEEFQEELEIAGCPVCGQKKAA